MRTPLGDGVMQEAPQTRSTTRVLRTPWPCQAPARGVPKGRKGGLGCTWRWLLATSGPRAPSAHLHQHRP